MPDFAIERHVPFSATQMFDLVLDVEHYADFMPLEYRVTALERAADELRSRQTLRLGPIRVGVDSHARYRRPDWIAVDFSGGPFRTLRIDWTFASVNGGCQVRAQVSYKIGSPFLQPFFAPWVSRFIRGLVSAFEQRAADLYGAAAAK